jgi:glutamate-5-semialdehyde dehydrogenase
MNDAHIIEAAAQAKAGLARRTAVDRTRLLQAVVAQLKLDKADILAVNAQDVQEAAQGTLRDADIDRMTLTPARYDDMLRSVEQIAGLEDIIGTRYDKQYQASGITTSKMRVPIGIILMIYESRPNVTIDAAALAIRTGNVIILKGGKEVAATNKALHESLVKAMQTCDFPPASVIAITDQAREMTTALLKHDETIDLVIPRGSRKLLEFVQANTVIPALLHLEGNCHVYIDAKADQDMALKLAVDAKTQRFGTCNTAESILVHQAIAPAIIPELCAKLSGRDVEIRGDQQVCELFKAAKPATEADWSNEYLAPIVSIKVVDDLDEAIRHINTYGSGHTDAIVTEDQASAERFLAEVDSSSVMHNTSTRLADGFEYGLGAEIGISTGKLHARGPVGQEGLTTYKWIVESDGVTRG